MYQRVIRLLIVCIAAVAMAACGDDGNNGKSNNGGADTGNNGETDSGNNGTPDMGNNGTTDMDGNNGTEQCSATGEDCTVGDPTATNFVCADIDGDGTGTCFGSCTPPQDEMQQYPCQDGQICIAAEENGPTFCHPSECAGLTDTTGCDAVFPTNGGHCFPDELLFGQNPEIWNNGFLCSQAGTGAAGDSCEGNDECMPGTLCTDGTCTTICEMDDDCDTANGERCVGEDGETILIDGAGLCNDNACDAYSEGQCSGDEVCFPVSSTDGICEATAGGSIGEDCDLPSQNDPSLKCAEGLRCTPLSQEDINNGVGRCLPYCDATADDQDTADTTCGGGTPQGFGRFIHLLDGGGAVDIYVDGTMIVDDLAEDALTDSDDTTAGAQFFALDEGQHTVDIVAGTDADNSNPLVTVTPNITGGDSVTWAIAEDDADPAQILTVDIPRNEAAPASGNGKVRIAHASEGTSAIDVAVVPAGETDFTNEIVVATDVDLGAAGSFVELSDANDWDAYVFNTGTTRSMGAELFNVTGLTVTDGEITTWWARGNENAGATLVPAAYLSAPTSDVVNYYCEQGFYNRATATNGVCLQTCAASDFGQGTCEVDDYGCRPYQGERNVCFTVGTAAIGDSCDPTATTAQCAEGGTCRSFGDGTGECVSYCEPSGSSNTSLQCVSGETCDPIGDDTFDFGSCGIECTETDFADTTNCPANLQNCFPDGDAAFCSASGSDAAGDQCDDILVNSCEPGNVCANKVNYGFFQDASDLDEPGTCVGRCEFYTDGSSGCASGESCVGDYINLNKFNGVCLDQGSNDPTTAPFGDCSEVGKACGERGTCVQGQMSNFCWYLCDPDSSDATNCPGNATCEVSITQQGQTFDLRTGPFGACIPSA